MSGRTGNRRGAAASASLPLASISVPRVSTGVSQGFVLYMRVANATLAAASPAFFNDTRDALAVAFALPNTPHAPLNASSTSSVSSLEPGIYISSVVAAVFPTDPSGSTAFDAVAVAFDIVVPLPVRRGTGMGGRGRGQGGSGLGDTRSG